MKTPVLVLLLFSLVPVAGGQKGEKTNRLSSRDADGDGRLSREELGETFWKRAAGYDANGEGALDAPELAALSATGRRGKEEQTRPGGANAAFAVREFTGSNGETIRYSLFVPSGAPANLPLVLCLHGAGGNTEAAKMNGVAIWAFHGEKDEAVPVSGSRDMIVALKAAGVKPEPKYTEFPGLGHGSWGPAYEMAELWEWLFAQSR